MSRLEETVAVFNRQEGACAECRRPLVRSIHRDGRLEAMMHPEGDRLVCCECAADCDHDAAVVDLPPS
jgi:hypothetical protein